MAEKRITYKQALAIVTRMHAMDGAAAAVQSAQQFAQQLRVRLTDAATMADLPLDAADLTIHIDDGPDAEGSVLVEWKDEDAHT